MNHETPGQDEKDEITSLVAKSAHELSTRGSLVTRGLRDIRKSIQADPSRLAEEAIKLHSLGKFTEAVAACDSALGIDPDFDVVLLQIKGASLAKQGRVVEGLEFIDKALRVNSEDALSWYVKSRLLQMANRTEEQLDCLRRVVGIESSVKGAWKDLGSCLLKLVRYEEAVEAFDSGLRQNPSDEDCRLQREIALSELSGSQKNPTFFVVYDNNDGWHVMKEDDMEWEFERIDSDGSERWRPPQLCFGPSFRITTRTKARREVVKHWRRRSQRKREGCIQMVLFREGMAPDGDKNRRQFQVPKVRIGAD
jgi:tetratricopeptide (TPR) repeat protein